MALYKLITFDITGTLLKGKKPLGEVYAQAGKLFGITGIKSDSIAYNFKKEWDHMCKNHPNFGLHSGLGWISWWKSIVRCTITNSNCSNISDEALEKLSSYLIYLYSTKDGWQCENGTVELLQYLKSKRVEIGVISNFDPRLHNVLKELKLDNFFSFVLTSYETSYSKPDIKMFKLAEKEYINNTSLNIEGRSILHVGNSLEHDVIGACKAGWSSAFITSKSNFKENYNSIVFRNLTELNNFLFSKME